ncbi:hypothetical protein [Nocardioides soli]|uniref:Glycosyltransferase RgtA/B/C/D-like domain-containing protein n=1 Tax=Nocardioides soli TaxID=1036020 RepID=A0A7W4VWE9_9ACTN|nr:hypothetical protein [Nocardioides soli]MBB3042955.1 hypothetical protein [Nocardioides soli]
MSATANPPANPPAGPSAAEVAEPVDPAVDHVRSERERLAGVVQSVHQRPRDIKRRPWESAAVFVVSAGAYAWFGYWLVVKMHVVGFETLDRLNRALMIWHNDPAKLSAIGFDYPPLATLLISPLAIFRSIGSSLAVVPLTSALFAGLTMVALNTLGRRAQIVGPVRYAILVALALNPLVALYAAGGARQLIAMSFVVVAMGALVAWYVTADVRFVMLSGIAFSVAALSGYSSLLWFVLSAIMIGGILAKLGADGQEVEGTTVGFAAPTLYVIALWTVFNLVLLMKPFYWITSASDAGGGDPGAFTGVDLLRSTGELVLYGAPIAIVALPALIFVGASKNNPLALWLGLMLAAAIACPALSVLLDLTDSPMQMRNSLPILLFSVIGGLWLARSSESNGLLVSAVLTVLLVASIPWTFHAMKSYRYQNLEAPFAAAVSTGESQEGSTTLSGASVGVVDEQAMADYIKANISDRNSILTDNSQTYAVMLLTGRPDLFFDRVDHSDGPWKTAAQAPAQYVDYLLMSTGTGNDLLSQFYPDAADGADPRLPVVYNTDRYVLVGVPAGFDPDQPVDEVPGTTATGGAE